ncbi:hypothetical protein KP509_37G034700 [Ceratopteris richardii]|uniref:TF-B3 domain-containing protein n=1 Tax=Ceratopteris richardii TaxID=49495 RepID=A0A8T2Q702_CERRI|nr:hypothetical protein KP509_37G034700 [Ceratopteris richardii]
MGITEPDKNQSSRAADFQVIENREPVLQETLKTQNANVYDAYQSSKADKSNDWIKNRHILAQSSMAIADNITREFLSSISTNPDTLSGLHSTCMEAGTKDITSFIGADPSSLSGLYSAAGVVKDLSVLSPLRAYEITDPHATDIKTARLNTAASPIQRFWNSQKPRNHQPKSFEKETPQLSSRIPRPPSEGRGKNQLLSRYCPRITDQELQLLAPNDSNCVITPLFEKVLSMSDAGKIGRLVLPKYCAEAYFPPICQAEGLPITVQDTSGKDWQFQFRFWPNNNSRMYVLEGITPCIQSMCLQAGDTVIFSRRDPGGKLVMGYRRASNTSIKEDIQIGNPSEALLRKKSFGQATSSQVHQSCIGVNKSGNIPSKDTKHVSLFNAIGFSDKRKANDLIHKAKRPRCDSSSLEFKLNWEIAQSFLRSPPNVTPSIVTIEGYDFEEYEDPPIFENEMKYGSLAQKSIDSQHDVPKSSAGVLLQHAPENVSDDIFKNKQGSVEPVKKSESFSGLETLAYLATAEEDINEAQPFPVATTGISSSAVPVSPIVEIGATTSTISVSASASSPATTTKHPRHRPGCSCIVCIQPPSGKGPKHEPNCDCNVCTTVKRRFHTLMLRRKRLQSEKQAESFSQKNQLLVKEGTEGIGIMRRPNGSSSYKDGSLQDSIPPPVFKVTQRIGDKNSKGGVFSAASNGSYACQVVKLEPDIQITSKEACIDLNSQPDKEEEVNKAAPGLSMKSLLQNASYPLDVYLRQHGLKSLLFTGKPQSSLEDGTTSAHAKDNSSNGIQAIVFTDSDGPHEPNDSDSQHASL